MIEREEDTYFLCEYSPIGRVYYPATEDSHERFEADERITEAADKPNARFERCRARGLDPAHPVIRGAGGGGAVTNPFPCGEQAFPHGGLLHLRAHGIQTLKPRSGAGHRSKQWI